MSLSKLVENKRTGLAFLVAVAMLTLLQVAYWTFTVDDAYISYRYAENFANGLGLVFNPGERVEGYTNFLWTVLLAGAHKLGANTVLVSKLIGAIAALALLFLTGKTARLFSGDGDRSPVIVAVLLLAATPSFALWSVAGLETSFFGLLLIGGALRFLHELGHSQKQPLSAVLMVMCAMARPEGVLLIALSGAFLAYRSWMDGRVSRLCATWFLVVLVLGLPYFLWRLHYFGHVFPNTFYVKTGRGIHQIAGGVLYVASAIKNHVGLAFLLLAFVPAFDAKASLQTRYLVALLGMWLAYNIYKGHDVLSLFRFIVPILPIWYASASVAFTGLIRRVQPQSNHRLFVGGVLSALVLGSIAMNAVQFNLSRTEHRKLREYQVWLDITLGASSFMPIAERLRAVGPPQSSIAVIDAGVIPYVTGWYTIDRWGLLDEHIAHVTGRGPLGEKFDEVYVLAKRPAFIQTHVTAAMERAGRIGAGWAGDPELFSQEAFRRDYVRIDDPVLDGFFVRKDVVLRPLSVQSEGDSSTHPINK